ncbi:hypothetical protein FRC07_000539 [Ceratobasidium sp. 392]|nr:hypothetical protein FRC07_000539 [Ceratobasidium sp. 392]
MGRDTKPFLNGETSKPAVPLPRRASLTASFSLPTISLSSRSKAPPPSLPPLNITEADGNSVDDESASSAITSSASQPFPLNNTEPYGSRPSSPLKPPTSPGSSVPLPSIRSLRSRFSFGSGHQDQPNTPSRAAATPTQKRVTSRRFLPFGNSSSSSPNNNATPTVPRKSLGDVFALGRSSTSSRLDAASTRSATPSGRSVTSAATLRGWTSTSRHLEPGGPHSRLSFGRPRSHDYSLDADLGYVVAIGGRDETVRQRPSILTASSSPLLSNAALAVEESSQEDIATPTLDETVTHVVLPALAQNAVTLPLSTAVSPPAARPNDAPEPANARPSPRQSALTPIKIPPLSDVKTSNESETDHTDSTEKTPVTAPESENDWNESAPTAYPFTPVDDRSDVTSSTHNTPSSAHKSATQESQAAVPPLPSPSPFRSLPTELSVLAQPSTNLNGGDLASSPNPWADSPPGEDSASRASPEGNLTTKLSPAKSSRREHSVLGLLGELDGALAALGSASVPDQPQSRTVETGVPSVFAARSLNSNAASNAITPSFTRASLDLPSAREERLATAPAPPGIKLPTETVSTETKVALEKHRERLGQLLSSLDAVTGNGDLHGTAHSGDSDRLTGQRGVQLDPLDGSAYRGSGLREDHIAVSAQRPKNGDRDDQNLHTIDSDLAKLLSPHRLAQVSHSAPGSALVPTIALPPPSPRYSPQPLPSGSRTPQPHTRPDSRAGSSALYAASTPSPSTASFRPSDIQLPSKYQHLPPSSGASNGKGYHSAKNSPVLSKASLASASPAGVERGHSRDFSTPNAYPRTGIQYAPSASAAMTRKRSASFDLSGSTTFMRDSSDPFITPSGPRRTDWLGPRTAKAFAAAGLLDTNTGGKERPSPISSARSDGHRAAPWRTQQNELGRMGSIRSHSRLGSEIVSPSSRTRALTGGTDSSPSYRRGSLDQTAPPSPVSTHRTLVSSAPSSSQSQQSALQTLRERHELETEALLLALAGSKKSERDLRVENEQLTAYIGELERRIAALEGGRDQERGKWHSRDRPWGPSSASDVESLDKRRQDILAGRPLTRGWSAHNRGQSAAPNRSPAYGDSRPLPSPNGMPRSASVAAMYRSSDFDAKPRSATPSTRRSNWVDLAPTSRTAAPTPRNLTPPSVKLGDLSALDSGTDFDQWHEESFAPPPEANKLQRSSLTPSNISTTSLIPDMPAGMSLLVQESGPLSEDEYSFRSSSPASLTLVQPRNSTPKPAPPANVSPITADFSFNSIPGSPRSLRLRPEEEMHLADLISLQGLEITDVLSNTD